MTCRTCRRSPSSSRSWTKAAWARGRRLQGLHQPNASRLIARLEAEAAFPLLDRHPRGSRPTPAGLVYAAHARELLAAADHFTEWLRTSRDEDAPELRVGASMTIAEHLVPVWLTELRRRTPDTHVHLEVENSTRVIDDVREGRLRLGFVETPHIPRDIHARVVADDELILVIAAHHPWAERTGPVGLDELAATALVVREGGSGTREALEAVVGDSPAGTARDGPGEQRRGADRRRIWSGAGGAQCAGSACAVGLGRTPARADRRRRSAPFLDSGVEGAATPDRSRSRTRGGRWPAAGVKAPVRGAGAGVLPSAQVTSPVVS